MFDRLMLFIWIFLFNFFLILVRRNGFFFIWVGLEKILRSVVVLVIDGVCFFCFGFGFFLFFLLDFLFFKFLKNLLIFLLIFFFFNLRDFWVILFVRLRFGIDFEFLRVNVLGVSLEVFDVVLLLVLKRSCLRLM